MTLGFIGGGTMGEAIIAGVLANTIARPEDIAVCDILPARREYLRGTYGVQVSGSAGDATSAQTVVLAVKPPEFPDAARQIVGTLSAGQTVLSIMAGVGIATVQDAVQSENVVRAIPNTPAQIGEGMTVWTAASSVSAGDRERIRGILAVLGQEIYVSDEKFIDMATAVSSSGPAYMFLVMEAMIDAAVHVGLRRDLAETMVIQTMLGSARYAQATGKHPAELKNQVTSPGGTTTEGLRALEESGVRAAFVRAVEAAYEKARRLGG